MESALILCSCLNILVLAIAAAFLIFLENSFFKNNFQLS
jgi:hypothetical protein